MCGNGGRCIVAFAYDCGIRHFDFEAADGWHTAEIVSVESNSKIVRLKMKDVEGIAHHDALEGVSVDSEGSFLDTGTRHYVRFVDGLDSYDVVSEGRDIRYNAKELQPVGANVNFVEQSDGYLKIRTYEKGVEDETYACGTGIVASCIAAYAGGKTPSGAEGGRVRYDVMAKKDSLSVDFRPAAEEIFPVREVYLTGPAVFVAEIILPEM